MNETLQTLIRRVFRLDESSPVDPSWTSGDVEGWDSLGHLDLILALEKTYGIKLEIEEMFDVESLGDLEQLLRRRGVLA